MVRKYRLDLIRFPCVYPVCQQTLPLSKIDHIRFVQVHPEVRSGQDPVLEAGLQQGEGRRCEDGMCAFVISLLLIH